MEDVVMAKDGNQKMTNPCCKDFTMRDALAYFINAKPKISNLWDVKEDGEKPGLIKFAVTMKEMGFPSYVYPQCRSIIFSRFFVNFAGELLVREHLDLFVDKIVAIKDGQYEKLVDGWDYNNFGMKRVGCDFVFSFHISLVRDLLAEDFKKQMEA